MRHEYPYTDMHELNLDWFLGQFKNLKKLVEDLKKIVINAPDATTATAGQAPIADGQGGWQWGDVQSSGSGLTTAQKSTLMAVINAIGAFNVPNGQELIDAFNSAWDTAVESISINPTTLTFNGVEVKTITATTVPSGEPVIWTSSDTSVADVEGGQVYSVGNGTCTITASSGDKSATCAVTVTGIATRYTVTNNLTNVTNSNDDSLVAEGGTYEGTLTAESGYIINFVTVTMDGTDVTSTVYADGDISIANVTGNIVITAEAVEDVGWVSGVPYDIEWTTGQQIDRDTGVAAESGNGRDVSDFLPCSGVSALTYENISVPNYRAFYYYDANKDYIYSSYNGMAVPPYPTPRHARFVRFHKATATDSSNVTVTPYKYPTLTENTAWVANQRYVLSYSGDISAEGSSNTTSDYALCYGASKLYTNLSSRSFIYFSDSEKNKISTVTVQNPTNLYVDVPEEAYYFQINPNQGILKYDSNTNNPWVYME